MIYGDFILGPDLLNNWRRCAGLMILYYMVLADVYKVKVYVCTLLHSFII